jgi:hypothetical protein
MIDSFIYNPNFHYDSIYHLKIGWFDTRKKKKKKKYLRRATHPSGITWPFKDFEQIHWDRREPVTTHQCDIERASS